MIEWLGMQHSDDEALQVSDLIEQAISEHLAEGELLTYDLGGTASTSEVGSAISERLANLLIKVSEPVQSPDQPSER
jgi:isocitrate/isopropylmalate dehydrogenase